MPVRRQDQGRVLVPQPLGDSDDRLALLMCSRELATLLRDRYPSEPEAISYLDEVRTLSAS
ncbi:hypothetical protein C1I99_20330 [Micromonospora deserti]|uniref:Uncharacterized protein n=1 Tax=Micromonospora deserti TaxID=2070366 RepID=A0A2W2CKP4_9ACTN|nr:hypothetical protein C1I99_20330 [Micromonospora deserti]